ncbi:MAG: hypothetical protein GWN01_06505 [Nitrosopumilaceae archaeon]|nr:hypothetical protein [Nitrosopumilaceae archaeon]NIU00588.1 hypothetical protein [Nitrosopumilaceae archaeon]NIU86974.1 hypothetical protein [Nitrosopumilaceae archaeon]NIV66438.1 hypothetical protein [Nitrosopumilaceae archaeon]NIX61190.1 hypothetical protein [Nitrosopumilaceae archaeon]
MSQITKDFKSLFGSNYFFDYSDTSYQATSQCISRDKDQEKESSEYLISFSDDTKSFCVGMVDMVNSTKTSAMLGLVKSCRYYQIFLNSMSRILSKFGEHVIKNVGDFVILLSRNIESARKKSYLLYGLLSVYDRCT